MKIRDIVNRDIVNLTNCEQEPIHIPGSIQNHGFIIAMRADTMLIDYCSANVINFLGVTHEQCLGKRFADVFGEDNTLAFHAYAGRVQAAVNPPLELILNGKDLLCTTHKLNDMYIAEFEPSDPAAPAITSVYNQTVQFVGYMEQSQSLQELCMRVAEHTRAITGYDRVMVYRFDKDYNGEVFAESRIDALEPFLGLHYPHTDIPAQARQLYLTNLMRIIVDVNDTPVPIYTIDDAAGKNLDLSRSYLRSVSPIHIEYLKNMGVGGTLTISLINDGRLWGLITCHHYSARYVPLYARIAAQMQGYFLTSQINVRQLNEEFREGEEINMSLEKLLVQAHEPNPDSFEKIAADPALLALCNASGAAILFEGRILTSGKTPAEEDIRKLASWLNTYSRNGEFSTARLADFYPDAKQFSATGAGVIYHSLGGLQDDAIIWFARETNEEVHWAGDPSKAIVKNEKGLSPRNSFKLWKQKVQYESMPWKRPELLATATFAHALQKHITLILISEEERRQRQLTEQLREANTELENINWISSHDLKEPLRKIQMFSSRILDKEQQELSEAATLSLRKITRSAGRMQQLLSDITTYNRVRHLQSAYELVNLTDLLNAVAEELKDELTDKDASLTYMALPVISGVPFLLKQLFVNLLRNSLKFARKDVPPAISVTAIQEVAELNGNGDQNCYRVDVADNGIGFNNTYAESIFKVFTKLHGIDEYEGSGVGLALCRKIMQNHSGIIRAHGEPNTGATFSLYFPVSPRL